MKHLFLAYLFLSTSLFGQTNIFIENDKSNLFSRSSENFRYPVMKNNFVKQQFLKSLGAKKNIPAVGAAINLNNI